MNNYYKYLGIGLGLIRKSIIRMEYITVWHLLVDYEDTQIEDYEGNEIKALGE